MHYLYQKKNTTDKWCKWVTVSDSIQGLYTYECRVNIYQWCHQFVFTNMTLLHMECVHNSSNVICLWSICKQSSNSRVWTTWFELHCILYQLYVHLYFFLLSFQKIMKYADKNKDGKITKDEFVNIYKILNPEKKWIYTNW